MAEKTDFKAHGASFPPSPLSAQRGQRKEIHVIRVSLKILLVSAIVLVCAVEPLWAQEQKSADQSKSKKFESTKKFSIKGTLAKEDETPIEHAYITVHKATRTGLTIETGSDGRLANPQAKSDSNGHFTIEVDRSFLPSDRKITLSCSTPWNLQMVQLTQKEGQVDVPVVIEVHPEVKTIDLDKIIGKIIAK